MGGKNDSKSKHILEIGKLIRISLVFAALAWILDSVLDSLVFHEGTLSEQMFAPTYPEIGVRLLFAFILVIFGAYIQLNATKRIRAEEALRQSEEKYRMLIDNINEGVFIIQDAKLQYVNEAFTRTSGYTMEEIIGRDFRDFVAPEDLEMVSDRYYRRQAGENVPSEYEFRMLRRDGTKIIVNMNVGLMTHLGRVASMGILKDITERKRAEEAVKLFSEAVENAPDGVQITDMEGNIIYSNKSVEEIFGFSPEELKGKHVNDMNSDPEFASKVILPGIKKTGRWSGELVVRHKNGKIFPILLTTSLVKNGKGEPIAMIGIIHDITKRKQAEEALKESEKRYRMLFENAGDAIFILEAEGEKMGQIVAANQAAADMHGYTVNELLALNITDLDTQDAAKVAPDRIQHILKGKHIKAEITHRMKDGTIFPVEISAELLELGNHKYILAIDRDITERKRAEDALRKSEERYRNLFENSPISLWEEDSSEVKKYLDNLRSKGVKDLKAYFNNHPKEVVHCAELVKIVDVNKATLEMFKARNKEELMNGIRKVFTERSYNAFKEELAAVAQGKTVFECEDTVRTLSDEEIYISLRWSVVPGYEETYSKRLVSIIDITERKRAEEVIEKYAAQLEDSNRMKELFTDIMHHDLLNPLNVAKGYVELLLGEEKAPNKIASLGTIERNLAKGMELIENATMLSKLESLESIRFETLDLKEVTESVTENLTPLAAKAGIKIENRATQSMPIRGNKIIEEVFANIISNAVKYAPQGNRIIVDKEDMGESWRVKVIDFGEGIPDAFKTAIFERFLRVEKKGVNGSGLGLAIAWKIMEFHKGRIWVEDNPEGGAVFVVEMPKS